MDRGFIAAAFAGALALQGCGGGKSGGTYPLLDGSCDEYAAAGAAEHPLDHGVRLLVFEDSHYVWLCAALPPRSFGTLDLAVESPALAGPLNLHVSAQLGEWPVNDPAAAPQSPDSDQWWRIAGWSAVPMRMNGMVERPDGRRPNYLPSPGRELQLAKARFGAGEWRLRFKFDGVRSGEDGLETVTYPADGAEPFILDVE